MSPPCTDGGVPYPEESQAEVDRSYAVALLCAMSSHLEENGHLDAMLAAIDWREAGVPRKWFVQWWKRHKREDRRRRREELAARNKVRSKALSKLTAEEREALGIQPENSDD